MKGKLLIALTAVLFLTIVFSGCQEKTKEIQDCGTKIQAYIEYVYQNNWTQKITMDIETKTCNSYGNSNSQVLEPGENLTGSEIRNIWSSGGLEINVTIHYSSFTESENYSWMPSYDGERVKFLIYADENGKIKIEETTPSDKHPLE